MKMYEDERSIILMTILVGAVVMIFWLIKSRRGCSSVRINSGEGGLERIELRHESGAYAEIYSFGATVSKYVTAEGVDLLWVSSCAKFDGKKAIRGGIPIAFPQFGPKADTLLNLDKSLAQHGFARVAHWEIIGTSTEVRLDSGDCQATLRLRENESTVKQWPYKFELEYIVRLSATCLRTELKITNLDETPIAPQALLHTYYRTDDINDVRITGLRGKSKYDQLSHETTTQDAEPISFNKEFDVVFDGGIKTLPEKTEEEIITVSSLGSSAKLRIGTHATYIEEFGEACAAPRQFYPDVVVWNPHINKAKAMADFDDDGWTKMLCVEPGVLNARRPLISPGNSIILGQSISYEHTT